jgi:nucleoside 2-deoxyribosyltransferase
MRLYVAGRIADEKDYIAKFDRACNEVKRMGCIPVNPCNLEHNHGKTWAEFMVTDIKAMLDCDGVYALNDWRRSKGATIEVELAISLGKRVVYQP